ncbi:WD40/YVTN/BNR-like repeat-containing protein [Paraburkholderia dipogonis]
MYGKIHRVLLRVSLALCAMTLLPKAHSTGVLPEYPLQQARAWVDPGHSVILGATRAETRIVTVGEHGIILLSDDEGRTFRQARVVPTRATLNDVAFVNAREGWAVGHEGIVLHTNDGGETWLRQRVDTTTDQPLFSVAFIDSRHGIAVGLWSLALRTDDGGAHWTNFALPSGPGKNQDRLNLYSVAGTGSQRGLLVTAEQGVVFVSSDAGETWKRQQTGYTGSLWTGLASPSGTYYVAGLRGSVYQSRDSGESWRRCSSSTNSSITRLVADGTKIVGVGLDGTVITSSGGDCIFTVTRSPSRSSFTAAVFDKNGKAVLFSKDGLQESQRN